MPSRLFGRPPAVFRERVEERRRLAAELAAGRDGRDPVLDRRVLAAMATVPRHAFVPEDLQDQAYEDHPLPIGAGQTISQPYIVAKMTELLRVEPDSRVLEIGTGSGYQAAVLARLTRGVYSIEVIPELADRARALLERLGCGTVRVRTGDGALGWPEEAPFDRLLLTCAAERLPDELWRQLKAGGRAVYPVGAPESFQVLMVAEKALDGTARALPVMPVRFVPMTSA
jgi:protein-L-isoaspartate(D-aspartate) O-methyltransferase